MSKDPQRTRSLAHALARHLVQVTAFAALTASGAASAAAELRPVSDDDDMHTLEGALRRATEHVLATPPSLEDRPLLILLAAREAVAIAAVAEPEARHTAALLQSANIVEHLAVDTETTLWLVAADPPPHHRR